MEIWRAALVVLYELPPNDYSGSSLWMHVDEIAKEILKRELTTTRSRKFEKTLGKILRANGHGHFDGGSGSGLYWLKDRDSSATEYERIRSMYSWHFPQSSTNARSHKTIAAPVDAKSPAPKRGRTGDESNGYGATRKRSEKKSTIIANQIIAEEVGYYIEGATKRIWINAHERDQYAREACIREYGFGCSICKMTFENEFGDIGRGFIHVHHLKPLSGNQNARFVDPINDLLPVCANCHAMVHKGESVIGRPFSIAEVKDFRRRAMRRRAARRRKRK